MLHPPQPQPQVHFCKSIQVYWSLFLCTRLVLYTNSKIRVHLWNTKFGALFGFRNSVQDSRWEYIVVHPHAPPPPSPPLWSVMERDIKRGWGRGRHTPLLMETFFLFLLSMDVFVFVFEWWRGSMWTPFYRNLTLTLSSSSFPLNFRKLLPFLASSHPPLFV